MTAPRKNAGRKPVHLSAAGPKPRGRDAVWATIRKQRTFTYRSLQDATDIPKKTIQDYLRGLEAAGIIARQGGTDAAGAVTFTLARDKGVHAPRVRKDGTDVEQGRATEAMWTAMRLLKQFTSRDLAIHASTADAPVSEIHAKDYCKYLAQAKYLRIVTPGRPGTLAVFQFVRFTGPKAPMIQRVKQVFDPNTGEVIWPVKGGDGR